MNVGYYAKLFHHCSTEKPIIYQPCTRPAWSPQRRLPRSSCAKSWLKALRPKVSNASELSSHTYSMMQMFLMTVKDRGYRTVWDDERLRPTFWPWPTLTFSAWYVWLSWAHNDYKLLDRAPICKRLWRLITIANKPHYARTLLVLLNRSQGHKSAQPRTEALATVTTIDWVISVHPEWRQSVLFIDSSATSLNYWSF